MKPIGVFVQFLKGLEGENDNRRKSFRETEGESGFPCNCVTQNLLQLHFYLAFAIYMFDIFSQTKVPLRSKQANKILKIYAKSHHISVVVQFYPWFKFIFLCFWVW